MKTTTNTVLATMSDADLAEMEADLWGCLNTAGEDAAKEMSALLLDVEAERESRRV